jgi:hypothetical protein
MSSVAIPSPYSSLVSPDGRATQVFREYLQGLDGLKVVTLASLPKPIIGYQCYVSDATGGGIPCFADGTNWRRVDDRSIVS